MNSKHDPLRRGLLMAGVSSVLSVTLGTSSSRAAALRSPADAPENAQLRQLLGDTAVSILSYASLAPSGHNAQPWVVDIVDRGHWRIGTRRENWLPAVDPSNRETLLSIGAFLENLAVAAGVLGRAIDYEVIADSAFDPTLIDLRLRPATPASYPLPRLQERRTLRTGYGNEPLRMEDIRSVTGGAAEFTYLPRDSRAARYLAEATIEANRAQTYRDPAQEELADWIRWSTQDQLRLRNGLTPAGMEIDGILGWYVGTFYDRTDVLTPRFREAGIKQAVERVSQGAGWVVMTGPDSVAGLIETGRRFQRMWLLLREHSIAIHPMSQVLEESSDTKAVARELGIDGIPQFVLRIGYVTKYPDPVSPRMPVTWFTQKDEP
jgi:hypothetical protein